jgi:hypothetical protein
MPDVCADFESLRRIVQAAGWRRIGIDGVDRAGKSRLAGELSEALGYPVLDLDDYLFKNQGGFVPFIDYPALVAALTSMPEAILSGVCMREVLENARVTLDGHIYIKRMRHGLWTDEDACVFPEGVEVAIETFAQQTAMLSRFFDERPDGPNLASERSEPDLSEELMRYHNQYEPQEAADIVYERQDHVG